MLRVTRFKWRLHSIVFHTSFTGLCRVLTTVLITLPTVRNPQGSSSGIPCINFASSSWIISLILIFTSKSVPLGKSSPAALLEFLKVQNGISVQRYKSKATPVDPTEMHLHIQQRGEVVVNGRSLFRVYTPSVGKQSQRDEALHIRTSKTPTRTLLTTLCLPGKTNYFCKGSHADSS